MHAERKWLKVWNYCVLRATTIWRSRHLHPRSALTLYPCLLPHRRLEGLEKRYTHSGLIFLLNLNWCPKLVTWVTGNEAVSFQNRIAVVIAGNYLQKMCFMPFKDLISTTQCTIKYGIVPFHITPRNDGAQSHTRGLIKVALLHINLDSWMFLGVAAVFWLISALNWP